MDCASSDASSGVSKRQALLLSSEPVDVVSSAEKACAVNAFAEMGADQITADAIYLLERISRLGLGEVSERDMHVATKSRLRTKDDLMPAVQRLADHGYLASVPTKPTKERGRPASPRYKVWEYRTEIT